MKKSLMLSITVLLCVLTESIAYARPDYSDVYDTSVSGVGFFVVWSLGYLLAKGQKAMPCLIIGWAVYFVASIFINPLLACLAGIAAFIKTSSDRGLGL